jgi:hypothetical protein
MHESLLLRLISRASSADSVASVLFRVQRFRVQDFRILGFWGVGVRDTAGDHTITRDTKNPRVINAHVRSHTRSYTKGELMQKAARLGVSGLGFSDTAPEHITRRMRHHTETTRRWRCTIPCF